jgi:hypothetical protein
MVEKILRNVANVDDEDGAAPEERWLRDAAYRLAASIDPTGRPAKLYAARVRDYVKRITWPVGITPKDNLGTFLNAGLGMADVR